MLAVSGYLRDYLRGLREISFKLIRLPWFDIQYGLFQDHCKSLI